MSDSIVATAYTMRRRHDGVSSPALVHDRAGSDSSNEGHEAPRHASAQFSKTTWRGRRVSPPHRPCFGHEKGPLGEGPGTARPKSRPIWAPLTRLLLSSSEARATAKYSPRLRELGVAAPISETHEGLANRRAPWARPDQGAIRRAKRRFPTCRTLPESSLTGTSSRSGARLSPSSFTPP